MSEVSPDKLRGGFYTPQRLVEHAVSRVRALTIDHGSPLRVLEPSSGDGAFLEGLAASDLDIAEVCGIEIVAAEAAKCHERLVRLGMRGSVINESTLSWSLQNRDYYDVVVGNLPFVRFQFISPEDRKDALRHAAQLGVALGGVANLWLPILLAALRRLRVGGCYSLVLPAECFTGISAGSGRAWILEQSQDLRCDLFPSGSYPGVLQEVVILSGRRTENESAARQVTFVQHDRAFHASDPLEDGSAVVETHTIPVGSASWTPYLLSSPLREAIAEFSTLDSVRALGGVAKIGVAAVTGANAYFSLTRQDLTEHGLHRWARPLLPRARHAPGLVFTEDDYDFLVHSGNHAYLFDAGYSEDDPFSSSGARAYIEAGERAAIHRRYKCRIRSPWYAVPHIKRGRLLMSKRSHRFPRLILNDTDAVTTDTIYCGTMIDESFAPAALVAGFLNSGTLLSAELEGRNFGGGVLELVPSEVARLLVPTVPRLAGEIDRLDRISRETVDDSASEEQEVLIRETDLLLVKADVGFTTNLADRLAEARAILLSRRLDRATSPTRR
jgi:hypothetical protein